MNLLNTKSVASLILITAASFSSISYAGIIPLGIQTNVSDATVAGWGWSECSRTGALITSSSSTVVSACDFDNVMMGAWDASLGAYGILAAGDFATVTTATVTQGNQALDNWSNGVNWYRTTGYGSWGFTSVSGVHLSSADVTLSNGVSNSYETAGAEAIGLSWHTNAGVNDFSSGWAYNPTGLSFASLYQAGDQRVFWGMNNGATAVPEPSILALMGLGIFGLGLSRRKMKK